MNQRGDKISPVTELGYEIRVLIEFSIPGQGCGALNIIEFDRLMKRAPFACSVVCNRPDRKPVLAVRVLKLNKPHGEKAEFSKHIPNVHYDYT